MRQDVGEYINGEDLPTCSEEGDETWEEEFFMSIISDQHSLDEESPIMHHLALNHLHLR